MYMLFVKNDATNKGICVGVFNDLYRMCDALTENIENNTNLTIEEQNSMTSRLWQWYGKFTKGRVNNVIFNGEAENCYLTIWFEDCVVNDLTEDIFWCQGG